MKTKYPDCVPVLTEKDFKRGGSSKNGKCHCLMEWANLVFASDEDIKNSPGLDWDMKSVNPRIYHAIYKEIVGRKYAFSLDDIQDDEFSYSMIQQVIIEHNDNKVIPKKRLAEVWNSAMRKLGYTKVFTTKKTFAR